MKKQTIAIVILAIVAAACFGGCMYTQNIHEELEVNYMLAVSARENYRNDIARAEEIFAQLEPSLTDEQKALIEEWRRTRTRTLEEITNQTLNNIQGIGEAGETLKDNVSQQIEALKGD